MGLKITFGQWECSKFDFGAKTPKSTFLTETEKHHSNFFYFEDTFRIQQLKVRSRKVGLKITLGQWECSKFDFGAKTPKFTFLNETEKHHSNFFFFWFYAIDVSQKQKKSEKKYAGYAVDPYMWILHFLAFLAL